MRGDRNGGVAICTNVRTISPVTSLRRLLPILTWAPNYQRPDLRSDLAAGLTVGAMLVPQAMAYALLAGLPPEIGLYAATIPVIIYAVFGTSRQLAVGPVAIVSLLTAAALAPLLEEGTTGYVAAADGDSRVRRVSGPTDTDAVIFPPSSFFASRDTESPGWGSRDSFTLAAEECLDWIAHAQGVPGVMN